MINPPLMVPAAFPLDQHTSVADIPPGADYAALGDACVFGGITLDLFIISEFEKYIVFFDIP